MITLDQELQNRTKNIPLCRDTYRKYRYEIPEKGWAIFNNYTSTGIIPEPFRSTPVLLSAFHANMKSTEGVVRKDGKSPYATHPLRGALIVLERIPEDSDRRKTIVSKILVHDALEEGWGVDAKGLQTIARYFPDRPDIALSTVILTEPLLDWKAILQDVGIQPTSARRSKLRDIAYTKQIKEYIEKTGDLTTADTSFADKLANLYDYDYLFQSKKSVTALRKKFCGTLVYFRYVHDELKNYGHSALGDLLEKSIETFRIKLGIPEEALKKEREKLMIIRSATADNVEVALQTYQQDFARAVRRSSSFPVAKDQLILV